jgi:hypothetical protein
MVLRKWEGESYGLSKKILRNKCETELSSSRSEEGLVVRVEDGIFSQVFSMEVGNNKWTG